MVVCSYLNCKINRRNIGGTSRRFHRFPREVDRRCIWIQFCQRESTWWPNENARLCSDHFEDNQYELNRQDGRKLLSPFAIPTITMDVDNEVEIETVYEIPICESNDNTSCNDDEELLVVCESSEVEVVSDHDECAENHGECAENPVNSESLEEKYQKEIKRLKEELEVKNGELYHAKETVAALTEQLAKSNNAIKRFYQMNSFLHEM